MHLTLKVPLLRYVSNTYIRFFKYNVTHILDYFEVSVKLLILNSHLTLNIMFSYKDANKCGYMLNLEGEI